MKEKDHTTPPLSGNELLNRSMLWSLQDNPIQSIGQTDSVMHAAHLLAEKKFQALPVRGDKRKFSKFFDVLDLAVALCKVTPDDIKAGKPLFTGTVGDVANISERNPWNPMETQSPLRAVVKEMAQSRIYRVPVMDLDQCLALVTQSDILLYIAQNLKLWPHLSDFSLRDEDMGRGAVISVREDVTALEAFQALGKAKKGGLAIVDADHKLVNELSGRDLARGILDPPTLLLPVQEYLSTRPDSRKPITLRRSASVRETISAIADHKKHRAFIVNESGSLRGLVSIIDLLRIVVREHDH